MKKEEASRVCDQFNGTIIPGFSRGEATTVGAAAAAVKAMAAARSEYTTIRRETKSPIPLGICNQKEKKKTMQM